MLTKKDYIKIAAILGRNGADPDSVMVREFCEMFKQDNPAFDAGRFKRAVKDA